MPRFILNDEKAQNSYGFQIKTSGIGLGRFTENPVMLDGHNPSNLSVIGTWKDIKTEKGRLTAETAFDMEDDNAKTIAGKVERGVIKGCSMGISFDRKNLNYDSGALILSECELLEASIVAIPSNANALRLYSNGELMSETDVKALCLSVAKNKNKFNKSDMKQVQLSVAVLVALGLENTKEVSESDINTAVLSLQKAKKETEEKLKLSEEKVTAYAKKEKEAKEAKITEMVTLAVNNGQITADKKQSFIDLANQNFALAKSTLEAIPLKRNFGAGVQTPAGANGIATMEEFQKLSLSEQLAFKEANPDGYAQILKNI